MHAACSAHPMIRVTVGSPLMTITRTTLLRFASPYNKHKRSNSNELYPYSDVRCFLWQLLEYERSDSEYFNQLSILSSSVLGCICNKSNSNLTEFLVYNLSKIF
jgi:hypothetical protein